VRDPGAVEDVERFYWEAIAIADTLGMVPALAHCHLGLGELYAHPKRGCRTSSAAGRE
jgi:hypothetical protein